MMRGRRLVLLTFCLARSGLGLIRSRSTSRQVSVGGLRSPGLQDAVGFGLAKKQQKKKAVCVVPEEWWLEEPLREDDGASSRLRLGEWLSEIGGELRQVALAPVNGDDNWGLVALEALEAGAVVLSVQRNCVVTPNAADSIKTARLMAKKKKKDDDDWASLRLALLLLDKKQRKKLAPWHAALPRSFASHPIFWDAERLSKARGSSLRTQVEARRRAIETSYKEVCAASDDFCRDVSMSQFAWAATCVESRSFDLNGTRALVAVADMVNHGGAPNLKWEEGETFVMRTTAAVAKGAELLVDYGAKCNSMFLMNYGFTLQGNANNTATLVLRLEGDRLATWKVRAAYDESFTSFLDALRSLFPLEEGGLRRVSATLKPIPAAVDREREVVAAFADIARGYLDALPDSASLTDDDTRAFVDSEREVLGHYVDLGATSLGILDRLETDAMLPETLNDHAAAYAEDLRRLFNE